MEFQKYGTYDRLDALVDSEDWKDRLLAAERKYGLDVLINDKDYDIRTAVAKHGYRLDVLINDEKPAVRQACIESNAWKEFCSSNWETLVHNKHYDIRKVVANLGYGLDILVNDKDWRVRCAVARQGYGLDILINDEVYDVREAVDDYLSKQNLTA